MRSEARFSGLHIQNSHSPTSGLSGQFASCQNGDALPGCRQSDAAAEKQLQFRCGAATGAVVENSTALHEKFALFRKEHGESREIQYLGIDIGLRKVRVDRKIRREIRRDAIFHVFQAEIGKNVGIGTSGICCQPRFTAVLRKGLMRRGIPESRFFSPVSSPACDTLVKSNPRL